MTTIEVVLREIEETDNEIRSLQTKLSDTLDFKRNLQKRLRDTCSHTEHVREPDAGIDERVGYICKVCGKEKLVRE